MNEELYIPAIMGTEDVSDVIRELIKIMPKTHTVIGMHTETAPYGNLAVAYFTWIGETSMGERVFTTAYEGDGVYRVRGILDDGTKFMQVYDDHTWISYSNDDVGDAKIADPAIEAFNRENEYDHVVGKRIRRVAGRCTWKTLFEERRDLIRKRGVLLEKNSDLASRMLKRVCEELEENKLLMRQKKEEEFK